MNTAFKINQLIKSQKFTCPYCEKEIHLRGTKLTQYKMRKKRSPNYTGPYCNRECASKYAYSKLYDYNHQLKLPFKL